VWQKEKSKFMLATLHPETLSFLKGLKKNNNKVWFDENRATYDAIRKQLLMVLQEIIEEMASLYPELLVLGPMIVCFGSTATFAFQTIKTRTN
jgi:hypothetical protein